MVSPTPDSVSVSPDSAEIRARARLTADIHLAEYQAIENRLTYWVTLQYAIYSVAILLLLGIVQYLKGNVQIWAGAAFLLFIAWAWFQTGCEMFMCVIYIEEWLRLGLQDLTHNDEIFWQFEPFMNAIRSRGFVWFEWRLGLLPPFLLAVVVSIWLIVSKTCPWALSDWLWCCATAYIFLMAALKGHQFWGLQRRMGTLVLKTRPNVTGVSPQ